MSTVRIWTDGSCLHPGGPGGIGILIRPVGFSESQIQQGYASTTNQRMELRAALRALQELAYPCRVILTTDSEYLRQGMTNWISTWERRGWKTGKGKPVKNLDLWLQLREAAVHHSIEWCWVKGHSGHPENEFVDHLAGQAARSNPIMFDYGFE